jgi:tetratricopeptide (TPR) repeat protein
MAIQRYPNHTPSCSALGSGLQGVGRFDECVEPLQRAIRLSPRDPLLGALYLHLGMCHFMAARYAEATASARLAVQLSPRRIADKKTLRRRPHHGEQVKAMTRSISMPLAGATLLAVFAAATQAATPADLQAAYSALAAASADPDRGRQLFTSRHGGEWSCSSCHGDVPTQAGRHASTGKPIAPLAPAFNRERFADAAKTEKWFRRNCNDVMHRECSPAEKADVISWLRTLK